MTTQRFESTMPEDNPYCCPTTYEHAMLPPKPSPGIGWRMLAVTVLLFGGASEAVGLFFVIGVAYILYREPVTTRELFEMFGVCTLFLGFGTTWVLSGFNFWTGQARIAFIACLSGLAFPIAFYQIFGW